MAFSGAPLFVDVVGDSFAELNGETVQGRRPVAYRMGPLLGYVLRRQVEQLVERFQGWEEVAVAAEVPVNVTCSLSLIRLKRSSASAFHY